MAIAKRDGSKYWYIQFQYNGNTYIKSSKTTDKLLAEQLEANWRKQLIEQDQMGVKAPLEIKKAFQLFAQSKSEIVSHKYTSRWCMRTAEFLSHLTYIHQIQTRDVEHWRMHLQSQKFSNQSIKHALNQLNGTLKYVKRMGYQSAEVDMPKIKLSKGRLRYLTDEEEQRLLQAVDPTRPELVAALSASASRALNLFAASPKSAEGPNTLPTVAGLQAVSDFLEANVPESERAKAGEVFIRILNGTLFELAQIAREKAGLRPMAADVQTQAFMTQAVLALSDVPLYPAPLVLQLADFTQVQASVFQVARAPGKVVVYLGCALLIFGVFSMLYIRERRLWVWLSPSPNSSHVPVTSATLALSTNRKTMDGDREFEHLKLRLLGLKD